MTVEQILQQALQHHQAGRLPEAEQGYKDVLTQDPDHPDALQLLGILANQCGHPSLAIDLIRKAIDANPQNPQVWTYYGNLGNILKSTGQTNEAIAAFRKLLEINPNSPEGYTALGNALQDAGILGESIAAHRKAIELRPAMFEPYNNLGQVLQSRGELDEAIEVFRKAIKIKNDRPEVHYNLAIALSAKGEIDKAITEYQLAIDYNPRYARAYNNLGSLMHKKKQTDQAIVCFLRAIKHEPELADAHGNLGMAYLEQKQIEKAITEFREALRITPDNPAAHFALANALHDEGQLQEAADHLREAIRIRPDYLDAYNNLATDLSALGKADEAVDLLRSTIARDPQHEPAHYNLGLMLLLKGNYQEGWREFEWRWKRKDFPGLREFSVPRWDGSDIRGQTIMLHEMQGYGDTIEFSRYVPLVLDRGAKVILECQPNLVKLMQEQFPTVQCIGFGSSLPRFDVHNTLLSLPHIFKTTLETIPNRPYIRPDRKMVEQWSARVGDDGKSLRVGLVWAGNPENQIDRYRSMSPSMFAPLMDVKGVKFFNLQVGGAPPEGLKLIDYTRELSDFSETAALIANLDLVITVETAVAHLAGAMGHPVWTLLHFVPDWRWLLDRTDSPWYPSMRLFRQSSFGDWPGVIERVGAELKQLRK